MSKPLAVQLLDLYAPIQGGLFAHERDRIEDVMACGTDAQIRREIRFCRRRIDAIQRKHAEKEA